MGAPRDEGGVAGGAGDRGGDAPDDVAEERLRASEYGRYRTQRGGQPEDEGQHTAQAAERGGAGEQMLAQQAGRAGHAAQAGAQGAGADAPASPALVYSGDLVCLNDELGTLGIVERVAGADSDDDEEDSEEEDYDSAGPLAHGHARVEWHRSGEQRIAEDSDEPAGELVVLDRSFMHGDIAARASAPLGETAVVTAVHLSVDLLWPESGATLEGVRSSALAHTRPFRVENYVVHPTNPWLGRVEDQRDTVTLQFADGAVCRIADADPNHLMPAEHNAPPDMEDCPFYHGMAVHCEAPYVLRQATWLVGQHKNGRNEGVVIDVEPGQVNVGWLFPASGATADGNAASADPPPPVVEGAELLPLSYFMHMGWQLGDWALLRPHVPGPSLAARVELVKKQGARLVVDGGGEAAGEAANGGRRQRRGGRQRNRLRTLARGLPQAALVTKTHTTVDVVWQSGEEERGIKSTDLVPVTHLGDHDFWPQEYVVERTEDGESDQRESQERAGFEAFAAESRERVARGLQGAAGGAALEDRISVELKREWRDLGDAQRQAFVERGEAPSTYASRRVGYVETVSHADRTAMVRWLAPNTAGKFDAVEGAAAAEEVSVYELGANSEYSYHVGDVVLSLPEDGAPPRALSGAQADAQGLPPMAPWLISTLCWPQEEADASSRAAEAAGLGGDLAGRMRKRLSGAFWVGEIMAVKNGNLEVAWANGTRSVVAPEQLHVIAPEEEDFVDPAEYSDDYESASEEEAEESEEEDPTDSGGAATAAANQAATAVAQGFAAAKAAAATLAATLVSARADAVPAAAAGEQAALGGLRDLLDGTAEEGAPDSKRPRSVSAAEATEAAAAVGGRGAGGQTPAAGGAATEAQAPVPRFDMVDAFARHTYSDRNVGEVHDKAFPRRCAKEWAMLQSGLPEGIYVRWSESRLDLVRAAVVGPKKTPYHDGLFLFDIVLPSDYPRSPPQVSYFSFGVRVNPNLYENGKVCLSLLNTWTGKGSEVWTPKTSSLLQVLVSIQGLVLNEEPYYNEAGYEKQVGSAEGAKNASLYNESAFLLSVKTYLALMRSPPQHFEVLVAQHFREVAPALLGASRRYLDGAAVGSAPEASDGVNRGEEGEDAEEVPSSNGFRLMLKKIEPKLEAALQALGPPR